MYGSFGRIDDAFLVNNTAARIVEARLIGPGAFPVNWQAFHEVDRIVREKVLPPVVVGALCGMIDRYVQLLKAEVQGYDPLQAMFQGQAMHLMDEPFF